MHGLEQKVAVDLLEIAYVWVCKLVVVFDFEKEAPLIFCLFSEVESFHFISFVD